MDRARNNQQTLLISDDNHIKKITSYLRKKSVSGRRDFKPNMFAFDLHAPAYAVSKKLEKLEAA